MINSKKILTQKEYLDWNIQKTDLQHSIAYNEKKLFETQERLKELNERYLKEFSFYPLIKKGESHE